MAVSDAIEMYPYLKKLCKKHSKSKRGKIIEECPRKVYKTINEISRNVLTGNIRLNKKQMKKIKPHKTIVRKLAKNSSLKNTKRILLQHGGALPALLLPAISLLASVVTEKFIK